MIVREFSRKSKNRAFKDPVNVYEMSCDHCGKLHERPRSPKYLSRLHFCSKTCYDDSLRRGGKASNKRTDTNLAVHGTNCFAHTMRWKQTMLERYGVDHPHRSSLIRMAFEETCLDILGVDNPAKSADILAKMSSTMMERYGVPWASLTQKCRDTKPDPELMAQLMAHRAAQGKHLDSIPERKCVAFLQELYGHERVTRWPLVDDLWVMDAVVEGEFFFQEDGVFWHGLDRTMEEILASPKRIDKKIASKKRTDARQDAWSLQTGNMLIRVTDTEVYACDCSEDFKILIAAKSRAWRARHEDHCLERIEQTTIGELDET